MIEPFADPIDEVVSSSERDFAVTRLEIQNKLEREVRAALDKLIHGEDYGLCEECDKPIPAKRLDAMPWARLCTSCQEKAEALARENGMQLDEAA